MLFYNVTADLKVAEQNIQTKYCKCNSFEVTTDLLFCENPKVTIVHICHELQVWNLTML